MTWVVLAPCSCPWACHRLVKSIKGGFLLQNLSGNKKVRGIRGYYYIPTSARFSSFKLVKKVGKYQTKAKCRSLHYDDRNEANCAHNPRPVRVWLS